MSEDGIRFIRNEEFWIVLGPFVVIFCLVLCLVFCRMVFDYLQNQNRPFSEVVVMLPVATIFGSVIAFISHVLSGPLLLCWVFVLLRRLGRIPLGLLLAITPVLGFLTAIVFGHISVSLSDDDYTGLTLQRFLMAWAFDVAAVALYWIPLRNYRSNPQAAA